MTKKVLFIVEGKLEEDFLNEFIRQDNEKENGFTTFEIYALKTNIYSLYKELKKEDFTADVRKILQERLRAEKKKLLSAEGQSKKTVDIEKEIETLNQTFTYTYLIFDFDAHHGQTGENRPTETIVSDNITKLHEMAAHFVDETDPTVGKLYINYPMMESFRYADDFFDGKYRNEYVTVSKMANFKRLAGQKKLCNIHLNKYQYGDFAKLTLMNLYKLNQLYRSRQWQSMPYSDYRRMSDTSVILERQAEEIEKRSRIAVLNTTVFFWLDYYGNKNQKFDSFVRSTEDSVFAPAFA